MTCDLTRTFAACKCETHRALVARAKRYREAGYDVRRNVDATGTRRRIEALACIGYSARAVAHHAHVSPMALSFVLSGAHGRVNKATAQAIASTFAALCMTPAEPSRASNRARNAAHRAGYAPPLAWDDIDDPQHRPSGIGYIAPTTAEIHAAMRERLVALDRFGLSTAEIAARLNVTERTVTRTRATLRKAA